MGKRCYYVYILTNAHKLNLIRQANPEREDLSMGWFNA